MTKPKDVLVTMKMSELRDLAESLVKIHEDRITRLERFANRLAREIGDMDNTRIGLTVEGEGLDA